MGRRKMRRRYFLGQVLSTPLLTTSIFLYFALTLITFSGCSDQKPFQLNEEIPLGLGKLKVYKVEIGTLKKYIAPQTYEGQKLAEQKIKSTFLAKPEHVPVCVLLQYDISQSSESKENKRLSAAAVRNAYIFKIVDKTGKEYQARLAIPKRASYYYSQGTILDPEHLKSVLNKLTYEGDFVVAFSMPKECSNLTLHIKNPMLQEGQPEIAAVSLGL